MTSASRAAAATTAGGPATPLAARATAPRPEGVRFSNDVGLKGGGGDDGRRACNVVGRTGHGASPGGGEGWRCRRRQGRHRRRRQEYLRHRRSRALQRLMEQGVADDVGLTASQAAMARLAGGSAMPSAARATAPLPEVVRTGDDVGLKGGDGYASKRACNTDGPAAHGASPDGSKGGGGDDGKRACDAVGTSGHGSPPGGGEGRRSSRPGCYGYASKRACDAAATAAGGPATPTAARDIAPLPDGVRASEDVGLKGGGNDGRRVCMQHRRPRGTRRLSRRG